VRRAPGDKGGIGCPNGKLGVSVVFNDLICRVIFNVLVRVRCI
jgi:hypothetical protein